MSKLGTEQGHDKGGALQGSESLGSVCPEIYKVLVLESKPKLQFQFSTDCLDALNEPLPISGPQFSHLQKRDGKFQHTTCFQGCC